MTAKTGGTPFRGVRRRSWGRWVSEIRLPKSRERVWLGSFSNPVEAACAFDAATLLLRGSGRGGLNPAKRRSRRGLNLPHLQLAPFLDFASPIDLSAAASDPRAFKSFIRAVATSAVAAALLNCSAAAPHSVPQSPTCSVNSSSPSQMLPFALEPCCHSGCNSTTAESTTDDEGAESSPSPPAASHIWSASPDVDQIDCKSSPPCSWSTSPDLDQIHGTEQMVLDAIFFDQDLRSLRELETYLASEPFLLPF